MSIVVERKQPSLPARLERGALITFRNLLRREIDPVRIQRELEARVRRSDKPVARALSPEEIAHRQRRKRRRETLLAIIVSATTVSIIGAPAIFTIEQRWKRMHLLNDAKRTMQPVPWENVEERALVYEEAQHAGFVVLPFNEIREGHHKLFTFFNFAQDVFISYDPQAIPVVLQDAFLGLEPIEPFVFALFDTMEDADQERGFALLLSEKLLLHYGEKKIPPRQAMLSFSMLARNLEEGLGKEKLATMPQSNYLHALSRELTLYFFGLRRFGYTGKYDPKDTEEHRQFHATLRKKLDRGDTPLLFRVHAIRRKSR